VIVASLKPPGLVDRGIHLVLGDGGDRRMSPHNGGKKRRW
jgi:hypothetical protein